MANKIKPAKVKALNVVCSFSLLTSAGYIFFAGFNLFVLMVVAAALSSMAAPVLVGGNNSFLEVLLGILEAIAEGVVAIFTGIYNAISALFNW
ncbi:MAG: hypothetical protein JJT87_06535 [Halomonas sp.]|nr:hypothetical protein [Halomonas sp.]MCC5901566.1 hypothetical protein [Halomonas sp.]